MMRRPSGARRRAESDRPVRLKPSTESKHVAGSLCNRGGYGRDPDANRKVACSPRGVDWRSLTVC
jgi:hypothetical protein